MNENPLNQIEEMQKARILRDFTVPETLRAADPKLPTVITMKQLSAAEELMASKLGRNDYMAAQYAATKLSIVELDGKSVSLKDTALERFWEAASPKLRALLMTAYTTVSSPSKEEEDSFLKSMAVRV